MSLQHIDWVFAYRSTSLIKYSNDEKISYEVKFTIIQ